jgi:cytochrome c oxidase assembly protein subunit 15
LPRAFSSGAAGPAAGRQHIGFAALTAIHYTHRLLAYGVLACWAWLAWRCTLRIALRSAGALAAGAGALQLVTGLSNVVLDWPLVAAVLHTGGAAALVVVLTWALWPAEPPPRPAVPAERSTRRGSSA